MTETGESVFIEPGEATGRIRWEQPVLTLYGFIAGEASQATFKVWPPESDDRQWLLTSSLPGQYDRRLWDARPHALRKTAETWLEEFASSIGAVFPETPGHPRGCRPRGGRGIGNGQRA